MIGCILVLGWGVDGLGAGLGVFGSFTVYRYVSVLMYLTVHFIVLCLFSGDLVSSVRLGSVVRPAPARVLPVGFGSVGILPVALRNGPGARAAPMLHPRVPNLAI